MNTFLDLEKNHITILFNNAGRIFFQKQQNSRNDKTTPFKRAWRFMFGCSDKPSKSNVCVPFRVLCSFTFLPWTLFCGAEFFRHHCPPPMASTTAPPPWVATAKSLCPDQAGSLEGSCSGVWSSWFLDTWTRSSSPARMEYSHSMFTECCSAVLASWCSVMCNCSLIW